MPSALVTPRSDDAFWATREFGPTVTEAELAERASIATEIVRAWDAMRSPVKAGEMRPARNTACAALAAAFARVLMVPEESATRLMAATVQKGSPYLLGVARMFVSRPAVEE